MALGEKGTTSAEHSGQRTPALCHHNAGAGPWPTRHGPLTVSCLGLLCLRLTSYLHTPCQTEMLLPVAG